MKKNNGTRLLIATLLLTTFTACVQKSANKTIVFRLNVAGAKNIETVGIRGEGKPYSWNKDLAMTAVVKDSLYTATVTQLTGYKFVEVKFDINGNFELQDQPNRRIVFTDKDTTVYMATFNVAGK